MLDQFVAWKKATPPTRRHFNKQDAKEVGKLWDVYHATLAKAFPLALLEEIPCRPASYLIDGETRFIYQPFSPKDPSNKAKTRVFQRILELEPDNWVNYAVANRRFKKGQRHAHHMGFYEQNLPGNPQRTWKLYEDTDKALLLELKPLLKRYSADILKVCKRG